MARCHYFRRKVCRLLGVRSALLGVPLVWFIFILWTLFYTQTVHEIQTRRELIQSTVQRNYINEPHQTDHEDVLELLPKQLSGNYSTQNVLKTPSLHNTPMQGDKQKTLTPKLNTRKNGTLVIFGRNGSDSQAGSNDERNVHKSIGLQGHQIRLATGQDSKTNRSQSSAIALSERGPQPTSAEADYVEFVWKEDKPKPVKKFIIPGVRFDPPKLGEFGRAVKIHPEDLNSSERKKYDEGWETYKFNEYASLQISTQREVPDFRPSGCKDPDQVSNLPKASIIICFFNEAWSVLYRTIHSVLTRSPPELITEIILVDDHSNLLKMHEPLEYYVAQVNKLRLVRMTKRSGLVRARLAGVKAAKGPVIIFLDSHVECEEGWLPPLLQTILENPKVAVTPEIDVIDHKDFSIQAAIDNIGIFIFDTFTFDWAGIMPRIQKMRKSKVDPFMSPTMAGGLFAIMKDYFISIGTYDPGLELWGGENIELSLKLWMCGGGILIHPCSRVAHVFRDDSPYIRGKTADVIVKNSARVAQVWIDEYRDFYFRGRPYNEKRYGSVQERVELRDRLQCHSFSWYLENVYPELYIPYAERYLGKIESATGLCLHQTGTAKNSLLLLRDCRTADEWESTRIKEIRSSALCMDAQFRFQDIELHTCDLQNRSQTFEYLQNRSIYHQLSDSCLTVSHEGTSLSLQSCRNEISQIWIWPENEKYVNSSLTTV